MTNNNRYFAHNPDAKFPYVVQRMFPDTNQPPLDVDYYQLYHGAITKMNQYEHARVIDISQPGFPVIFEKGTQN